MNTLLIIVHVINCVILILAVLLQSGKSADLAGAFGGVGSQTAFGARGSASLLSKVTQACAIIFMLTSLGLWAISAKGTKSVLSGEQAPASTTTAPATQPAAQPAQTPAQAPGEKKESPAAKTGQTPPAPKTNEPAKK